MAPRRPDKMMSKHHGREGQTAPPAIPAYQGQPPSALQTHIQTTFHYTRKRPWDRPKPTTLNQSMPTRASSAHRHNHYISNTAISPANSTPSARHPSPQPTTCSDYINTAPSQSACTSQHQSTSPVLLFASASSQ